MLFSPYQTSFPFWEVVFGCAAVTAQRCSSCARPTQTLLHCHGQQMQLHWAKLHRLRTKYLRSLRNLEILWSTLIRTGYQRSKGDRFWLSIQEEKERGRKRKNWSSSYKGLSAKSLQLVLRQSGKSLSTVKLRLGELTKRLRKRS